MFGTLGCRLGIQELIQREFWKAPSFEPGVAKGVVVELLGPGRTEWLIQLFCQHPQERICWYERELTACPTALYQRGLDLTRVQFVQAGELHQPIRMALETARYPFIVAPNKFTEIKTFQRFHLLAEKSKSTLFLLGENEFSPAWPISLQLEIFPDQKGFDIFVKRQRHGFNA